MLKCRKMKILNEQIADEWHNLKSMSYILLRSSIDLTPENAIHVATEDVFSSSEANGPLKVARD